MATTLVGIFDDYASAQRAVQELTAAGISQGDISVARNEPAGQGYTTYGGSSSGGTQGQSIGGKISNFFESIFGGDVEDDERGVYAEAVRRGSVLVAVNTQDQMVDRVAEVLNANGAIDIDRRAAQYRSAGYQQYDANAPLYNSDQTSEELRRFGAEGEVALPVIEEELQIGKRAVQRGGVRVHTRVTERPVEETVNLREEHVHVERRPVDRAVSEADVASLREGEFVVTETAEEAVVAKQARVVEEVVVGKNVEERTETVRDTVRRSDVDVQEIDTTTTEVREKGRGKSGNR